MARISYGEFEIIDDIHPSPFGPEYICVFWEKDGQEFGTMMPVRNPVGRVAVVDQLVAFAREWMMNPLEER